MPATAASTARSVARADAAPISGPVGSTSHHLAVALELPGRHRAAGEPAAQAGMVEQVARMLGSAARIEIGRRRGGGEALHARPDRHGDHVLLQPLVVADAGVAAGRQHVDEAVLDDDLQPDVGIGREKRRHDRAAAPGAPR